MKFSTFLTRHVPTMAMSMVLASLLNSHYGGSRVLADPLASGIYVSQQPGYQELSQMVRVPAAATVDGGCRYLAGTVRTEEHGYSKALLVKLGPDNRELWSLAIGTKDNFGVINSAVLDKDGTLIVAGKGSFDIFPSSKGERGQTGIVRTPPLQTGSGFELATNFAKSYWIARVSQDGKVLAAKSFDEPSIAQNADPRQADSEASLSVKQLLLGDNGEFWMAGDISGRWMGKDAKDPLGTLSQGRSDLYCIRFSPQLIPIERHQWGKKGLLKADVACWTGPRQMTVFGRILKSGKPGESEMGPAPAQAYEWTWNLGKSNEVTRSGSSVGAGPIHPNGPALVSQTEIGELAVNAKVLDYTQANDQELILREGADAQIYLERRPAKTREWKPFVKLPFGANVMAPDPDGLWLAGFGRLAGARELGGCDISLAHMNWEGHLTHPHILGSSDRDYATRLDFDPSTQRLWIGATTEGQLGSYASPSRNTSKLVSIGADLNSLKSGTLVELGEEPPGPVQFKNLPSGARFWSEERPGYDHLVALTSGTLPRLVGTRQVPKGKALPTSHFEDAPFVAALTAQGAQDLWEHQLGSAPNGTLEPLISLCVASLSDSSLLMACRQFQSGPAGRQPGTCLFATSPGLDQFTVEHLNVPGQSLPSSLSPTASNAQAFLVGQMAGAGQLWRLSRTGLVLESFPVKGFPHRVDAHHSDGIAISGSDNFSDFGENWLEIRRPSGQLRTRLSLGKFRVSSIACNNNGPLLYGNDGDHLGLAQYLWEGRLAWARTFGTKGRQIATRMRPSQDGGYWLCGSSSEPFPVCKGQGGMDALLLKVDSFGKQQSAQQFGSRYSEHLVDVLETPDRLWLAGEIEASDYTSDLWTLELPK